jgi:hypothetical protein
VSSLILRRASANRPSGQWRSDDCDMLCEGMWSGESCYGYHRDRTPTFGYETTREAAMAAFAKS